MVMFGRGKAQHSAFTAPVGPVRKEWRDLEAAHQVVRSSASGDAVMRAFYRRHEFGHDSRQRVFAKPRAKWGAPSGAPVSTARPLGRKVASNKKGGW